MKNVILFILSACLTLTCCTNYESESYIQHENKVIEEIIPKLLNHESFSLHDWEKHDMYIIDELINKKEKVDLLYDSTIRIINDSTEEIASFKSDKAIEENKLFSVFSNGKIHKRKLQHGFTIKGKSFKLITNKIFREQYQPDEVDNEAYIRLSRIVFNYNKTKGYMYYQIYCGSACMWDYWIEIEKEEASWVISRSFSGGIA